MAEITILLDDKPLKRLATMLRSPKLLKDLSLSKRKVLTRIGRAMKNSLKENFERGMKGDWRRVSNDILLRRKMQNILSSRRAKHTKPPFGILPPSPRSFLSERAIFNVRRAKVVMNLTGRNKVSVSISDTTKSPDLFPFDIGEIELLENGMRFNRGLRRPKNAKALLIPVSNISSGKFRRKNNESKQAWMARVGILKSRPGITILFRGQASVGVLNIPRRRFIGINPKARKKINAIIMSDTRKTWTELVGFKQTTKGRTKIVHR